jgi:flavorubredoxin
MKKIQTIYEDGDHKWMALARDSERPDYLIDTVEYVVSHGDDALLTDPGGSEIFPAVFSGLCEGLDPNRIRALFASHQDPDIISSLSLWLNFNPALRCYLSWLWASFVPHFGGTDTTFVAIPDEGMNIPLGGIELRAFPAHYLHSSGNFHLYDAGAKIMFSGDVGAAMLPAGEDDLIVVNFDRHIRHAEGFHRRWMGSKTAVLDWCQRASELPIDMLCPQHGAIYQGDDVARFIDWLGSLDVGSGLS